MDILDNLSDGDVEDILPKSLHPYVEYNPPYTP
jgi:hypothetical protein